MAIAIATGMPTEKVHVIHQERYETIPEFIARVGQDLGNWIPDSAVMKRDYAIDIRILLEEGDN